jgi:ABC-type taurine transport system ATPase subunit
VLGALGLDMNDLFPEKLDSSTAPIRNPFSAADLLRIIHMETLIVNLCAEDLSRGISITHSDRERLKLATERISEAARYANV